jgi:hypothetical protein
VETVIPQLTAIATGAAEQNIANLPNMSKYLQADVVPPWQPGAAIKPH